jgi:hypothetical protein
MYALAIASRKPVNAYEAIILILRLGQTLLLGKSGSKVRDEELLVQPRTPSS